MPLIHTVDRIVEICHSQQERYKSQKPNKAGTELSIDLAHTCLSEFSVEWVKFQSKDLSML